MAPEAHDLEQLLHGLAKPALAGEHAGELEADIVVERIDGELLAQLRFAWAARAGLRELKALLERGDAIGERDVARYFCEQLGRFGGVAGGECRLGGRNASSPADGTSFAKNSRTCASGIAPMN